MLAAAQRLRRSSEFAAVIRAGRRAGRGAVVVHLHVPDRRPAPDRPVAEWRPDRDQPDPAPAAILPSRAGFVVPRAVGGASLRNLVRRRLRHLVRERLDRLPAGAALVVRALPAAGAASYARLGTDLDAALAAAQAPRGRMSDR